MHKDFSLQIFWSGMGPIFLSGNIPALSTHPWSLVSIATVFHEETGLCYRSAFQLFVKKKLGGMEGSLKEKMTALGQQWQALGKKQKKYTKKLAAQQELYKQQLEEFKQVSSFKQSQQSLLWRVIFMWQGPNQNRQNICM